MKCGATKTRSRIILNAPQALIQEHNRCKSFFKNLKRTMKRAGCLNSNGVRIGINPNGRAHRHQGGWAIVGIIGGEIAIAKGGARGAGLNRRVPCWMVTGPGTLGALGGAQICKT